MCDKFSPADAVASDLSSNNFNVITTMTHRPEHKPDSVRLLLEAWYNGSASDADEQRLINWFCNTPDAEIPADLVADSAIFRAMGKYPVPTAAEAAEAIDSAVAKARKRHKKLIVRRFMLASGVAAAAASLIALFNIGLPRQMNIQLDNPAGDTSTIIYAHGENVDIENDTVMEVLMHKSEVQHNQLAAVSHIAMPLAESDFGYKDVTPEMAAQILENSLATFDRTLLKNMDVASTAMTSQINNAGNVLNATVYHVAQSTDRILYNTELILKTINIQDNENR